MSPVLPSREYISRSFSYRDNPSRVFGCCIGDTSLQNMGTEADWGDPVADPYHSYKIFAAGQGRYFPVDLSASSLCPNFRECKGQLDDAGRVLSELCSTFFICSLWILYEPITGIAPGSSKHAPLFLPNILSLNYIVLLEKYIFLLPPPP